MRRTLAYATAAVCLLSAGIFAVPARAQASPLDDANFVRQQAGLPLLTQASEDEAARQVNETLLQKGRGGIDEDLADQYCGCLIDENPDDYDAPMVYATERYRQLGGNAKAAFWTYFKQASPRVNRTVWALLLDPRASSMRWSESEEAVSITVFYDPNRKFTEPQISHAGSFNPVGTVPLFALLPSIKTKTTVYRGAGKKWYPEITVGKDWFEYDDIDNPPIAGYGESRLVNLATSTSRVVEANFFSITTSPVIFAHSTRYRVGNTTFKTTPLPRAIVKRKFKSARSMSYRYRKVMQSRFAQTPRAVRKAIGLIDGWTTLKTRGGGTSYTIFSGKTDVERPFALDYARSHLGANATGKFITIHELGHLLDFTGLTYGGQRAFQSHFRKSRLWRSCYPGGSSMCVPSEEILADQLAFGMGGAGSYGTYGDPKMINVRQFNKLFGIWWAPKPLKYGFNLGTGGLIEGGTDDDEELEELEASSRAPGVIALRTRVVPSTRVQRLAAFDARR